MKFLENISQILESIVLVETIADSKKTVVAAIIAVGIYLIVKAVWRSVLLKRSNAN